MSILQLKTEKHIKNGKIEKDDEENDRFERWTRHVAKEFGFGEVGVLRL